MDTIKLSDLEIHLLKKHDAWRVIEKFYEDNDMSLLPAYKDRKGLISKRNGEVWCLSKAIFSNNEQYEAGSLCRGDSGEGPLLWSIWNGIRFISLVVPPTPDFVLGIEGPENFCEEFKLKSHQIFPIHLEVMPRFKKTPSNRGIVIGIEGVIV